MLPEKPPSEFAAGFEPGTTCLQHNLHYANQLSYFKSPHFFALSVQIPWISPKQRCFIRRLLDTAAQNLLWFPERRLGRNATFASCYHTSLSVSGASPWYHSMVKQERKEDLQAEVSRTQFSMGWGEVWFFELAPWFRNKYCRFPAMPHLANNVPGRIVNIGSYDEPFLNPRM